MTKILTRYGDGSAVELTESELMEDLIAGTEDAAERGNIPAMTQDEMDHLADIFKCTHRVVGVDPGYECVLSYDGAPIKMLRTNVTSDRITALQIYEKLMGADTLEMGFVDYSYKPIKPILTFEEPLMEQALLTTTAPIMYGAQPNLGRYSQPDGPFPNPAELMPMGKIKEAQESYELAVDEAVKDMVDVASSMYESGVDCILLDTVGAAGDADALAGLRTAEILREKYPDIGIEMGMAGEFVLGMHGALEYEGVRLAGLYNHQMLELAQKAGVNIFGTVMNTSTTESTPWNLARAVTFTKACSDIADIPIHANIGMGVGGVTVHDHTPIDVTSRASKALVELCNLDGL
ncbi:dimethylamine:corrinoid methyltransferase [Desulfocicer vacuolatum DSM 3385]|uniref:Dimethylamine:corrinoid methyltransferase n=1 Tax=Desulfocicer vacuolatum DSM 3385 TaxID=1121400 RepID=A0A1W2CM78_9BACT|nr:dimethylamine:corrinoid methyltransferase [Desulfocicer vacuolatum DSM 3385]